MLGLAIGDGVGYPIEFQQAKAIKHKQIGKAKKLYYSDDTQMSIATAKGILRFCNFEHAEVNECIRREYLVWYKTQIDPKQFDQCRAPGGACMTALSKGGFGTVKNRINDKRGCGTTMRVAPIGIVFPPEKAFRIGMNAGAITHGDPVGFLSSGFQACLIS